MFSIKKVWATETDKRRYIDPFFDGITIGAIIEIHNTTTSDLRLRIEHWETLKGFYGIDTISLDAGWSDDSLLLLKPSEKREIVTTTAGFLDGIPMFNFEPIFGYKEDYTIDMVSLLAKMRIMYIPDSKRISALEDADAYYKEPTLIKPSRSVEAFVGSNKDNPFLYWLSRNLLREELPFVKTYKINFARYEKYYRQVEEGNSSD
jgi:hypothetical protein